MPHTCDVRSEAECSSSFRCAWLLKNNWTYRKKTSVLDAFSRWMKKKGKKLSLGEALSEESKKSRTAHFLHPENSRERSSEDERVANYRSLRLFTQNNFQQSQRKWLFDLFRDPFSSFIGFNWILHVSEKKGEVRVTIKTLRLIKFRTWDWMDCEGIVMKMRKVFVWDFDFNAKRWLSDLECQWLNRYLFVVVHLNVCGAFH